MRRAGRALHPSGDIVWFADRLPDLALLRRRAARFDLIVLIGVWHHLDARQRDRALAALRTILTDDGLVLMRVRHGATPADRPGFDLPLADTLAEAERQALRPIAVRHVEALQRENRAAGVSWTWVALSPRTSA